MAWTITLAILSLSAAVSTSIFSPHDALTTPDNGGNSISSSNMFLPLFVKNHDHQLRHKEDIFFRRRLRNRSTTDARMPLYDDLLLEG